MIDTSRKEDRGSYRRTSLAIWAFLAIFFSLALFDFYQVFILVGNPPTFLSKRLIIFYCFLVVWALFWIGSFWGILRRGLPLEFILKINDSLGRIPPVARWLTAGIFLAAPVYLLLYSPVGDYHPGYWFRLVLLISCASMSALFFSPPRDETNWLFKLAGFILLAGAVFTTADWLNDVSSYPFSLDWSEGNRIWDYSMLFGSSRYLNPGGKPFYTFIEPGRQFLWGLPFLLPNLSIFGYRLWNALVWILPPAILAACSVVGRPFSGRNWFWQAAFIVWGYMFLSQGPIYSPLLLSAALVVIAVRQKNLLLSMSLVALAAYYAHISRWTWMYAPGVWAGLLALLSENEPGFSRQGWKKMIRPALLGGAGYLGAQWTSLGKAAVTLPSMETKVLLWDRLLPNPTYPPGILLGIAWVGLPVMLLIFWMYREKIWKPNWLQGLSAVALIGLFLTLGIFVSVKIGGGNNLHNLDMLWVTLALLAGWLWKMWMERGFSHLMGNSRLTALFTLVIIFPTTMLIQFGEPFHLPPSDRIQTALSTIQTNVAEAQKTGDVLFMDQRQLITFGYIKDLPMIAEYEKKYLMEQAMAGNEPYLKGFQTSLERKDYSLIVTFPISDKFADEGLKNFAEENNAWVEWVAKPLLKYYKPLATMDAFGIQLLVPRK